VATTYRASIRVHAENVECPSQPTASVEGDLCSLIEQICEVGETFDIISITIHSVDHSVRRLRDKLHLSEACLLDAHFRRLRRQNKN
jgi:hypothetical protein